MQNRFHQIEADALDYMKDTARTVMQSCHLMERSLMRAWRAMAFRKWRDMTLRATGRPVPGALARLKNEDDGAIKRKSALQKIIQSPNSYGVFSPRSGIREAATALQRRSSGPSGVDLPH